MEESNLRLAIVVSQLFAQNTYIAWLSDRSDCLVIDPGLEPDKILTLLAKENLTPAALLCTHGHADHIAGLPMLKEEFPQAPLIIGRGDTRMLSDAEANLSAGFGIPVVCPPPDQEVSEGETISVAGFDLDVLEIPGHSPGHIVFVWRVERPYYVFGGDVLFQGSIGRTDFPNGSFEQLQQGIHEKLFTLPADTVVLPGHGEITTIGQEIAGNPFVGQPSGYRPTA